MVAVLEEQVKIVDNKDRMYQCDCCRKPIPSGMEVYNPSISLPENKKPYCSDLCAILKTED